MVGKCFHEKGFVPNEDHGIIFTDVQLPAGTSMENTTYNALKAIQQKPYKFQGEKRNHFYRRVSYRKRKQ